MDFENSRFQMNFLTFVKTGTPPIIVFLVTIILLIPLMEYTYGTDNQTGTWFIAIFMMCLNGIPPFILHLNYFNNDKGKFLEINKLEQAITIHENSQNKRIYFNDIDKIEKYQTNRLFRMSFKSYYYYKIILKDKTYFYISRLTIEKFENKIDNLKFEFISVFYPCIKKTN